MYSVFQQKSLTKTYLRNINHHQPYKILAAYLKVYGIFLPSQLSWFTKNFMGVRFLLLALAETNVTSFLLAWVFEEKMFNFLVIILV